MTSGSRGAGALLWELERQGLTENTLVIFTSDNGGAKTESNRPLRGKKGTTWEGGMRVPCLMRWPGRIPAGRECRELATAMDLYPTLAALGGAELPADRIIDGRDIRPLMFSGGTAASPHEAFFYYLGNRRGGRKHPPDRPRGAGVSVDGVRREPSVHRWVVRPERSSPVARTPRAPGSVDDRTVMDTVFLLLSSRFKNTAVLPQTQSSFSGRKRVAA
jgi:hypothetical protein